MLVEAIEDGSSLSAAEATGEESADSQPATSDSQSPLPAPRSPLPAPDADDEEQLPASPMSLQDGIRAVQHAFTTTPPARWPLYVRQAKQHLRTAIDGFDERRYGFASVVDLLRAAGKESVLRIERDRQGAIRVFPGANLAPKPAMPVDEPEMIDVEQEALSAPVDSEFVSEPVAEPPIVDAEPVLIDDDNIGNVAGPDDPKPRISRKRKSASPRAPRAAKVASAAKPRGRKPGAAKSV
jgi:hypothetical protein